MESYEDLIAKYKILLQNEKRRLTEVNFNLTENMSNDNNKLEIDSNTVVNEKCNDDDSVDDSSLNNESPQASETIFVQTVSTEDLTETNRSPEMHTKNMEQWVTDSFYTSFPSYNKQDLKTKALADDRRQDYKKYLAEVSNKKLLNVTKANAEQIDSKTYFVAPESHKISTRDKLLDDLKHSDLAFNFLNPDAIQARNQKISAERTRKKTELQQELMRQIEEKKRQIERLRAKEKKEDELLSRRLESEMKAMRLDEKQQRNKKTSTKVSLENPVNISTITTDTAPQLDYEKEKYKSVVAARKSYSENGKEKLQETNDREIYKFFSNSAPHNDYNANCSNMLLKNNQSQLHPATTFNQNQNQQCAHCQIVRPMLSNSCCHLNHNVNQNLNHNCCCHCNLLTNMDVCNNCRLAWIQSWYYNKDMSSMRGCRNSLPRDISRHLKRPQILEITNEDHSSKLQYPNSGDAIQSTYVDSHSMKPLLNVNSSAHWTRNEINSPTTTDEPEVSIRDNSSTLTNEELNELRRKNNILIAKYAQNYGSLRKGRQISNKIETNPSIETNHQNVDDSFPLPLMRENFTMAKPKRKDASSQSQAVKNLGYKWEIPVVQKQLITNNPSKVYTQVGSIAKQLQLEKLNFSDS